MQRRGNEGGREEGENEREKERERKRERKRDVCVGELDRRMAIFSTKLIYLTLLFIRYKYVTSYGRV